MRYVVIVSSQRDGRGEEKTMSYISVLLDPKSIRERHIRVAAIVIIMGGN